MLTKLKQLASLAFGVRVNKGYGITCDDSISLKDKPKANEEPSYGCKYVLYPDAGKFVLDGLTRNGKGEVCYNVKHIETGTRVKIPKHIFTLLFKKID